jgi:hypothetical protein
VSRGTSADPMGPYTKVATVLPPFHHNPTISRAPNGGPFILLAIGNGSSPLNGTVPKAPHNCTPKAAAAVVGAGQGGTAWGRREDAADPPLAPIDDPPAAGQISMYVADSVEGPWRQRPGPVLAAAPASAWDSFVTNPSSVYFFPNGSALIAYRGGPCVSADASCDKHHVGIAVAPSWDAPLVRGGAAPVLAEQNEDPDVFRDRRGNFHMLTHYFGPNKRTKGAAGGHAFSRDGRVWHWAGVAYSGKIEHANGTVVTVQSRQRPQVLLVNGEPAVLFTGVQPKNGKELAYTVAQPIARGSAAHPPAAPRGGGPPAPAPPRRRSIH